MEFINQNILLIGVVLGSGLALAWQFFVKGGAGLNPSQATLLINREDAVIVDLREADEFAGGHVPEARNIPAGKLSDRLGEIEKFKERPLILCCASGVRSAKACEELKKQGFTRLHSLDGGIDAWRQAGLPLKKGGRGK